MKGPAILIVDDNPRNLFVLEQALAEVDVDVVKAESGNRALAATFERDFALAILDVQMPEMDGFELATLLRGEPRTSLLPIIFLTAAAGGEARIYDGYAAGAVDYILKPFDPPALLAKARVFLQLDAQRRELEAHRANLEERVAAQSREIRARLAETASSEARFRTFFESAPVYCHIVSPSGLVTAANRAAQTALVARDALGHPFDELCAPESAARGKEIFAECLRTGAVANEPLTVLSASGDRRHVLLSASVVRDAAGAVLHAVAVQQDVTALREAEAQDRLARAVLDVLNRSEHAGDAISDVLVMLREATGFASLAVRLRDGTTLHPRGAPEIALGVEASPALDACAGASPFAGAAPVCMCQRVLAGRVASDAPWFTANRSFWTNGLTALRGGPVDVHAEKLHLGCASAACESVALIPLRSGNEVVGLLQMNDPRPNRLSVAMVELLESLGASIGIALARERAERARLSASAKLEAAFHGAIATLARAVETRDPYTAGHQRRVADLAVAIATECGLGAASIEAVRHGATLHDIGKIAVPAEILGKPGRLTPAEYEIVKVHPQVGYELICSIEFPWPIADIVWQHHERLDGKGYPRGVSGDAICIEARVLSVADIVESIAAHRPYRPALGVDVALAEIAKLRGSALDPDVVDACTRLFRERGYRLPGT